MEAYLAAGLSRRDRSRGGLSSSDDPPAAASLLAMVAVAVALVLAILDVKSSRVNSRTPSADVMFAVGSPILYWILNMIGILGHP